MKNVKFRGCRGKWTKIPRFKTAGFPRYNSAGFPRYNSAGFSAVQFCGSILRNSAVQYRGQKKTKISRFGAKFRVTAETVGPTDEHQIDSFFVKQRYVDR